jgi:hypothetical protein
MIMFRNIHLINNLVLLGIYTHQKKMILIVDGHLLTRIADWKAGKIKL